MDLKTIVVPTDFSALADGALAIAQGFANPRTRIVLLHVAQVTSSPVGNGVFAPTDEARRAVLASAQTELDVRAERLRAAGLTCATKLVEGTPHQEILRELATSEADLVVMATHGRTGLARVFLGSVAERVLAETRTPMLLFPAHGRRT